MGHGGSTYESFGTCFGELTVKNVAFELPSHSAATDGEVRLGRLFASRLFVGGKQTADGNSAQRCRMHSQLAFYNIVKCGFILRAAPIQHVKPRPSGQRSSIATCGVSMLPSGTRLYGPVIADYCLRGRVTAAIPNRLIVPNKT